MIQLQEVRPIHTFYDMDESTDCYNCDPRAHVRARSAEHVEHRDRIQPLQPYAGRHRDIQHLRDSS